MSTQPVEPARGEPVAPSRYTPARPAAVPPPAPGAGIASLAGRMMLTLLGAAGMIVGAFLKWFQGAAGTRITMRIYVGHPGHAEFIRSAGAIAILLGLVAIVGLAPRSGWLT